MSDDKLIKEGNTLSEIVAKLKCGSYIWGAKEDAVCKSALACGEETRKRQPYERMLDYSYGFFRLKQNLPGTGP